MLDINSNGNRYETHYTPLAAYLITEGFELLEVKVNTFPSFFVFEDSKQLHERVTVWQAAKSIGNLRVYYENYRKCLGMTKRGL